MKRFIWLILLAAAGYAVWKYYPQIERMARERTAGDSSKAVPDEAPPTLGTLANRAPTTSPPSVALPPAAAPTAEDDVATRYPLPEFRTIEALTGDWKRIPPSAFPRQVTLQAPVSLQLAGGAGSARFEPGAKVMAVSAEEDRLTVTPSIGAAVRGTIDIDQTDFKKLLGAIYEQFKDRKRAEVTKLRQQAREEAKKTGPALATVLASRGAEPPAAAQAKIGPRPEQMADNTVPIMLASIAIYSGNQPLLLQIATYAAGLCLCGSFMTRWAALPALIIAAIGVVMVFAAYVRMADGVTWQQATGMVAFGLAGISSLMILVEHKDEQCV